MGSAGIPAIKGIQTEFQCRQITKDGFDWEVSGSETADGDGKIFKFENKESQDHLCVEFYDESKASWTKVERKGEWPKKLSGHSTTLNSMNPHQIILFGGFDFKEWKRTNDLWLFHTQTLLFKKMEVNSEKPKERYAHQAVMMGKKIVVFGGWDEGYIHDMWMFHLNKEGSQWEKVQCNGDWPNISYESSSHATDDQIIWTLDDDQTLWKFEFVNSTWTKVGWNMHELQVPKIFGAKHWLLLIGKEDGDSCQIYCFNANGHENSEPVKFVQMTQVDQDSKNVIDCIYLGYSSYCFACCPKQKDGWIIIAKTKGTNKHHLFSLKICDEEIQSFIDYMARIRLSVKDADMSLVVGKDKTIIRLHKIVMAKSPWIDRCLLVNPSENPIQMPDCELTEVSGVLDYIYTGNIEWPHVSDWKAWIKLFNAAKKFKIKELTAEAFAGLKNATVNAEAFADAFCEASIHPLSYGMDALVEMFGNHPERKKIFERALKSKDVLPKKLMPKMLVLVQGDISDNPVTSRMVEMLYSGDHADMCLVIGRDKAKIPLHKIIMRRNPWIDSCLESSTESSIHIPNCEENEVFRVLLHIYTGKIQWPDATDCKGWIKLFNVLKKFEIDHLANKAADGLKNATAELETFTDAFQEASESSLPFGLETMIGMFGTHKEKKKIFASLRAKNILKKELMLQLLDHMEDDVFDDRVIIIRSDERKCSICFEVLSSPFQCIVPCGHSTNCANCLGKIRSGDSKCPLCRKDITDVHLAYL